jgi:excisionase family DNA binding protein
MSNNTVLLSVDEVAQTLGLHVRTIRRYLREGRLKGFKVGKSYRIASQDLAALTGQQPSAAYRDLDPGAD